MTTFYEVPIYTVGCVLRQFSLRTSTQGHNGSVQPANRTRSPLGYKPSSLYRGTAPNAASLQHRAVPSVTGSGAVSNVSTASAVIIFYVFFFFKCICVVSTLQKAAHVVRPFWPLHDRLLGQFWVVSAETTRLKTRRKHSESPMATLIINDVSLKTPCDIKLGKNVASIKLMCPSIRPKPAESSWAFWNET